MPSEQKTSAYDPFPLLKTVFHPKKGERVGVFIDLENPSLVGKKEFLRDSRLTSRRIAWEVFYEAVKNRGAEMGITSAGFFAYEPTGGSNLDLPPTVWNMDGRELDLEKEALPLCDIALYLTTYSATAPLTAIAKRMGFRGATLHGCNEIILQSGLSKDYDEVSRRAEKFRLAVTRCDEVTIEFEVSGVARRLTLKLGGQEAQKSHGICRTPGEIANLPAGEIYWVPTGAEGEFPLKFKEDGTLAWMKVRGGGIVGAEFISGERKTLDVAMERFLSDPAAGEIGELGLGTQVLPVAGADIQDEKILGTFHVATGRSDHLGGDITPVKFKNKKNATHEDILFAPHKTPEVKVNGVWMQKDGREELLIRDFQPTEFVKRVAL